FLGRLYARSGLQALVRRTGALRAFPRLQAMEALMPLAAASPAGRLPREVVPREPSRGTVAVLTGCVQSLLFPAVNRATVSLLARAGYRVVVPETQGCCGALHLHWGDRAEARRLARQNLAALGEADWIVTNAAGCGAAMREYGHLLDEPGARALAARVRDVTELLAEHLPGPLQPVPLTVTYH